MKTHLGLFGLLIAGIAMMTGTSALAGTPMATVQNPTPPNDPQVFAQAPGSNIGTIGYSDGNLAKLWTESGPAADVTYNASGYSSATWQTGQSTGINHDAIGYTTTDSGGAMKGLTQNLADKENGAQMTSAAQKMEANVKAANEAPGTNEFTPPALATVNSASVYTLANWNSSPPLANPAAVQGEVKVINSAAEVTSPPHARAGQAGANVEIDENGAPSVDLSVKLEWVPPSAPSRVADTEAQQRCWASFRLNENLL